MKNRNVTLFDSPARPKYSVSRASQPIALRRHIENVCMLWRYLRMIDSQNSTIATVSSIIEALPEPVKTSFFAAAGRMLGGLASFPAAWFRRPVQGYEDITDGRSLVAKGLAQAVLENAKNNPAILQAATEIYLPTAIRKISNCAAVASVAVEELADVKPTKGEAAAPDDDWMNAFMRYSEDASSERLQRIFGKILAGEIINPSTFSPTTLRTISEMTQQIADDFSWLWAKNIESEVPKRPEFDRGADWQRIRRLREAGLISPQDAAIFQPNLESLASRLKSLGVRRAPRTSHCLDVETLGR